MADSTVADSRVKSAVRHRLKTNSRASCKLTNMEGILHNKVSHLLPLFVCLISLTGVGFANPACLTQTLNNYVGPPPISCDISDKTFSNWLWAPSQTGGAGIIPANGVLVTPEPLPANNPGFLLSFAGFAAAGQTQDALFGVTVTTNGALITDMTLNMLGAGVFGDGSVTIFEDVCSDALWSNGCLGGQIFHMSTCLSLVIPCDKLSDHIDFTGEHFLDVRKDIELNGGTNGFAFLSGVEERFSQTPEPGSIVLFGSGVLGLAGVLRRKVSI